MSDTCPHPTLYTRDMFSQPRPWGSCLLCELDSMRAETQRLTARIAELESSPQALVEAQADTRRIDWLADANNNIGIVQLPTEIVESNLHSLRDAIDEAMSGRERDE